jgi:hypothetical protein
MRERFMVTHDGHMSGIVTDRDIVIRAVADGMVPNTVPLNDVPEPGGDRSLC